MNVVVPPTKRRAARGLVRVLRERAHERQIDVHVRIDETRENIFAGRIDNFVGLDVVDLGIDPRDRFVFAEDVRDVAFVGGDYFAILN